MTLQDQLEAKEFRETRGLLEVKAYKEIQDQLEAKEFKEIHELLEVKAYKETRDQLEAKEILELLDHREFKATLEVKEIWDRPEHKELPVALGGTPTASTRMFYQASTTTQSTAGDNVMHLITVATVNPNNLNQNTSSLTITSNNTFQNTSGNQQLWNISAWTFSNGNISVTSKQVLTCSVTPNGGNAYSAFFGSAYVLAGTGNTSAFSFNQLMNNNDSFQIFLSQSSGNTNTYTVVLTISQIF